MSTLKTHVKRIVFRLLGKDPEAVIVSFLSGAPELARAMVAEMRRLVPDREHFAVTADEPETVDGVVCVAARDARRILRRKRIALAPVLFNGDASYRSLRRLAFRMAPGRILAFNSRLERHHLRLRTALASWLFLRGVPLDRIFLRPRWLCPWAGRSAQVSGEYREYTGRPSTGNPRIGVLTPYFPYPLSHGGAVRMYNLLRVTAAEFDLYLFAFGDPPASEHLAAMQEICARVYLFPKPRYREPRWSTFNPPEVNEFRSHAVAAAIARLRSEHGIELMQVEYTHMATYPGEILVEHDVTFDLYKQVYDRERTIAAWWNYFRWRRFERRAVRRYRAIAVMSDKDAEFLPAEHTRVIPNGVDLDRFVPAPETPGRSVLFIGSFAHFPNIVAYRFLTEEVWPRVLARFPDAQLAVVCGRDPQLHWATYTGTLEPPPVANVELYGFVADPRPLYHRANIAVVPTRVSAGTNLKTIEALAMERAVVASPSGSAGLGLQHGSNVWLADTAEEFADAIATLFTNDEMRTRIASNARAHVEQYFGWDRIGVRQRELWRELLPKLKVSIRRANGGDLGRVQQIELQSHEAAHWDPRSYMGFDFCVACVGETVAAFMVSRRTAQREREVLNIAVAPEFRRRGIAATLIRSIDAREIFLEVRKSNIPARRLYTKLGFEEVGLRRGYYDDPPEDAVVMRWERVLPA